MQALYAQLLVGLINGSFYALLSLGLAVIFGMLNIINFAHGALYMMGAYFAATFVAWTGSFVLGALLALGATLLLGVALEYVALRHLYGRDHLDQVLATFGLILFFNDAVRLIWGPAGLALPLPAWLTVPVQIVPGVYYPAYRLMIIVVALAVAALLYLVVMRTRVGMLIRAGASNREMIGALGINIKLLFTLVFGLGAALAGLAEPAYMNLPKSHWAYDAEVAKLYPYDPDKARKLLAEAGFKEGTAIEIGGGHRAIVSDSLRPAC